jgi:hypothetical protein
MGNAVEGSRDHFIHAIGLKLGLLQ